MAANMVMIAMDGEIVSVTVILPHTLTAPLAIMEVLQLITPLILLQEQFLVLGLNPLLLGSVPQVSTG